MDTDFQGSRKKKITEDMLKLFGKHNFGTDRSKPTIQFIPAKYSEEVKLAHKYTQLVRKHKKQATQKDPNIQKDFDYLKK